MPNLINRLIALLLILAASAKLWLALTDPFADLRTALPWNQLWLVIFIEYWIAYLNLRHSSSNSKHWLWLLNILFFSGLLLVSIVKWVSGATSCGCLGAWELHPGWMVIIDAEVILWLLCSSRGTPRLRSALREIGHYIRKSQPRWGQQAGLILLLVSIGMVHTDIFRPIRLHLFGEPQIIGEDLLLTEAIQLGESTVATVLVSNRSEVEAKLLGLNTSCTCMELQGYLPDQVEGNANTTFDVRITGLREGRLRQRLLLFIDHPKQFGVPINVRGNVIP